MMTMTMISIINPRTTKGVVSTTASFLEIFYKI